MTRVVSEDGLGELAADDVGDGLPYLISARQYLRRTIGLDNFDA